MIARRPPAVSVSSGTAATGYTSSEEPTTSSRRARPANSKARSIASAGSSSPKKTTSGLRIAPQLSQAGASACSSFATTSSRGYLEPQAGQVAVRIDPCTSTRLRLPARSCRRSMFCVTTASTNPACSSAESSAVEYGFSTELKVRFAETDAQGIAHHAVYLVWFEVARIEYLARFRGGYSELQAEGIEALTLDASVTFRSPARFDDRLVV